MTTVFARNPRFIHSPELDAHPYPEACPFSSLRAGKARAILASMGLLVGAGRAEVAPRPASRSELERFHDPAYLDVLEKASRGEIDPAVLSMGLGTEECPIWLGMYTYAALACGASLTGVDLLLSGESEVAFNPSGGYHHAGPGFASGFCYLNDVVLACDALARAGRRVLFLDVDVHHGDGVQDAFFTRSDVMTISMHQTGRSLFPHTGFEDEIGEGDGLGYCANLPLPEGTYDEAFLRAFTEVVLPLVRAYDPDAIVLELGMDTLCGDPLAELCLTNNALAHVTKQVVGLRRPLLVTGGGGYHPENTARGWALAWSVMSGADAMADMALGLGGVMLESTDWLGGLRDRVSAVEPEVRGAVDEQLSVTIDRVKALLFPRHGLAYP